MVQISFEFFPPQTDRGRSNLIRTARRLAAFSPTFCSVTYGAGGTTRTRTFAAVASLREAGIDAAPHLSWGGDRQEHLLAMVDDYLKLGVNRIVALRGDASSGLGRSSTSHRAADLVHLLRRKVEAPLVLHVAAYPEVHPDAPSADADIAYLKAKVEAGADGCITQYFYNADAYFHFRDRCTKAGIDVPVVAGVMPISDYPKLVRFSDKAGAEIPRWMRQRLDSFDGQTAALQSFAAEVVAGLCERLLAGGAPGLHFYTLNRAAPTEAVLAGLSLETSA